MYVVTEYGIADLFCKPIEERVNRMIAIAHPDFHDSLRKEAIEVGLIRA
jgi:acyl-CoA hydrolase